MAVGAVHGRKYPLDDKPDGLYELEYHRYNLLVDEFIRHDREFHSCIYEMSLNRELMKLASNYYDVFRFLGMQVVMGTEERRLTTIEEHQDILEAMEQHNPKAAVQAMKKHMEQTETNIRRHIKIAP